MEEITCIFCGKINDRVIIEENGYVGSNCVQCGLIYISPRPSFNEIVDLYAHDDARISAESLISDEFIKRLYAKHNLNIVTLYSTAGTILEIGAGSGYFLDEARKLGFEPYGIEINPVKANFIRDKLRIPCESHPLSASSFEGMKFDVVYHCDVISHFFDPISEFREIHQRLKENGMLIFETGNLGEVNKKYFKYITTFQYPDHLFFFTSNNVIDLLRKTGFEFIKIYRYAIVPELMIMNRFPIIKNSIKNIIYKSNKRGRTSSDRSSVDNLTGADHQSSNLNSLVKKFLKNGCNYINYLLRYKIGLIAPKIHRPQTVIVVARKKI
jgi:2-polyprenyl-3-methyl-5-hydroxy-6-metoxy-1,4-benzoquinol methylase